MNVRLLARRRAHPQHARSRCGIRGGAPPVVKVRALKWLEIYRTPPRCFAGTATRRGEVAAVELQNSPLGDQGSEGKVLILVLELEVAEDTLDTQDTANNAFLVVVIDECVSVAVTALDYAQGGPGISSVSQSLNTVFNSPAELGAKLRFVNTTLAVIARTTSCRCEVWDLTRRRLVATAVFVGMPSSPPKAKGDSQPQTRTARL
ncbi:hypothetical protein FB451DRAFT_1376055 [Mycena latifolia]|nr:hypothetical protein FB451DRAFT_1376055 [Mycena latifolia]